MGGPIRARQIQDGGRPLFWKKPLNRHISATVWSILIWNLARWRKLSFTGGKPLKFRFFFKPRWRRLPSWKITKMRYHSNGLIDLREIWDDYAKWVSSPPRPFQKFWISKIQDGGRPPFWKPLNRHISATIWPILMKFGMVTQIGPYRALKFRIFQKPRWRRRPSWKSQKSRYLRNCLINSY